MTTDTILTDRTRDEVIDLAAHLFAKTDMLDWDTAIMRAVNELPELLAFAEDWDASVADRKGDCGLKFAD